MSALTSFALVALTLVLVAKAIWGGYPKRSLERSILSRKEQAIIASFADALFPSGGPIPVSGTEAGVVGYMDAYLRRYPSLQRILMRLLFAFIEHSPWIFGPRRVRFSRLSVAERVAVLSRMANSTWYFERVAFLSMRTVITMAYLANERVAECIGALWCTDPFANDRVTVKHPSFPPPSGAHA